MADLQIQERPAYRIYRWLWTGLDWLLPPRCGGCGKPGARFCSDCQREFKIISPPICDVCGRSRKSGGICATCVVEPPIYNSLRAAGEFSGSLRNAIHRLKYNRDVALGDVLARPMMNCLKNTGWTVDVVTPVPVSSSRKTTRGYNQAALLARPIALYFGLAYCPGALAKKRDTRSQVGLTADQRLENVRDAFKAAEGIVKEKRVLVIDDVTTSGATLSSCSHALFDAGAEKVYCLTLARAL